MSEHIEANDRHNHSQMHLEKKNNICKFIPRDLVGNMEELVQMMV